MTRRGAFLLAFAVLLAPFASGCHSAQVDAFVENRTGAPIDLLEVDYPSASFGVDHLAAGATYHYRFQVRLSGPIKVQYNDSATHQLRQFTGPTVSEGQEGRFEIVLLPDGKAEFHPALAPPK
ncbi:MAG: hypothetical protein WBF42_07365 [Terracidiphilus sp.]